MGATMYIGIGNSIGSLVNNPAASGGTPFTNTYSLEFDGVDDKVDCGANTSLQPTSGITLSCWFMIPTGSLHFGADTLISQDHIPYGSIYKGYNLDVTIAANGYLYSTFALGNASAETKVTIATNSGGTPPYVADTWYHLCGTWDGSDMVLYINGVSLGTTAFTGPIAYDATQETWIGNRGHGQSIYFVGSIDEVSIWNTGLSGANVATLYNSGLPTDLKTALASTPVGWWRMGDSGTFFASEWDIPDQMKIDNFSSYSFYFDGVNERFTLGSSISFGTTYTLSIWLIYTSGNRVALGGPATAQYGLYIAGTTLYHHPDSGGYYTNTFANIGDGNWHHVVIARSGSDLVMYVDGSSIGTDTGVTGTFTLGAIGAYGSGAYHYQGWISDVSVYTDQKDPTAVSAIYNSGVPKDESETANLEGYWRMGEGATFSTNWTVPDDSSNSNNATSANMEESDKRNTAPGNTAQGRSVNMDEVDRVTDVPT